MASTGMEWVYANNARLAVAFLGLAVFLLGIGVLVVLSFGNEASLAGATLLTVAVFLLVFSVLVFLPRVARRGAVSFSAYSNRSMDEAELAIRQALEASGHTARVEVLRSRIREPPRIVLADGVSARFRIETTRHPAGGATDEEWTEIIESFPSRDETEARSLRDRITERLAGARPADG